MDCSKKTIGIFICNIHDEHTGTSVNEICSAALAEGYDVNIYNSFDDFFGKSSSSEGAKSIFKNINFKELSGIIIFPETIKDENVLNNILKDAGKAGLPAVSVDRRLEGCSNVVFDYAGSFEKIVRHIVEFHKCRRINFLAGFKGNAFSDERLEVYRKVLEENGIPYDERRVGYGDFWEEPAAAAVRHFLEDDIPLPEALICANDSMAIAACRVLDEHGISVPDDMIVTGFDGIEQEKYHAPRLTTAYSDEAKSAKAAVRLIADNIKSGKNEIKDVSIAYDVGFSQSCGCKKIHYKNANKLVMELYRTIKGKDGLIVSMNSMTDALVDSSSITEALPKIENYVGVLYYDTMFIVLRENFLSDSKSADLSKDISAGEKMIVAEVCHGTHPELVMKSFRRGGETEYLRSLCVDNCPVLYFPLCYQEQIFGYAGMCFGQGAVNYDTLYSFSLNFGYALNTLKDKSTLIRMNKMLANTNEKLETAFTHDSMTGLMNRRGFYREIAELRKKYDGGYVFAASIDLDGLKYINDNFGHQEGDFAIKQAARAIKSCAGRNGICARFGGDEFMAVVFSEKDNEKTASAFPQKLQNEVAAVNNKIQKDYPVAASCGVQSARVSDELDFDELMRMADEKMYENKSKSEVHIRNARRT